MGSKVNVEVVYATPEKQVVIPIYIQPHATFAEAIVLSGILKQFDDLKKQSEKDFLSLQVGAFSIPCSLDREVQEGDRIEIYRPLQNDPKDARRLRASGMK